MKRTDKNGRVLMTGEQQLVDGSYEYRIMVKNRRYSICCDDLDELREEEKKFDLDKANLNEKPLLNSAQPCLRHRKRRICRLGGLPCVCSGKNHGKQYPRF